MPFFKNISIRYQFMIWIALVVTLSVIITGWIIHVRVKESLEKKMADSLASDSQAVQGMIKTSLTLSIRSHLRGIAEENVAILEKLYQDSQAGRMDKDEAWKMAEGILLSQTIGRTGYIYALTSNGVLAVHPNGEMKNTDMSEHWLSKTQVAEKEGFLEYKWKNPGEETERDKALYMAYFEPWDLIVSVSSYKTEFISLFDLEGLRSSILAFGADHAGAVFILDSQGDFLVRSNDSDQGQVSSPDKTWQEIFKVMTLKKKGQLLQRVQEKGLGRNRELLVFYNYIPDLHWFVGSYVFMDEIQAYLNQVRTLIMATTGVILILILPLSLYFGRTLTRPVARLAKDMNEAGEENFDIRADESGYGEVKALACHFNAYMEKLKQANLRLHREIQHRIYAEGQLLLFAEVFKNALEGISITDAEGNIIAVNQAFSDITGYEADEVMGKNPRILKSDRHNEAFYKAMWEQIILEGNWAGEIWNRRKNGEAFPEILSISAIRDKRDKITHYVAVFHDISEMKSQQEAIKHQAFHDALTGLPNRYLAQDRLVMAIKHARRQKERVAVFFLDMDNFKYVNDSLGHASGDILLQLFGQRIKSLVREQDTVARLGGDEFLVIALDIKSDREIIELSERLLQQMEAPFPVEGHELEVTFSLGVTSFPEDGEDAQTLIKNADVAMYQSKARGKNNFALFTPELRAAAARRSEMIREFRTALNQGEFKVHYQPKIDSTENRVRGVEALVRWEKQDKTLISPAEFIPLAEETGLILPLGQQVMEIACDRIKALNQSLPEPIPLAVNLSPVQFEKDDIVGALFDILDRSGFPPGLLELEITETTMMTDVQASVERFDIFKEKGVSIAIDDFGTGYSSLYYLKTFPISTLKIDRSFINDMIQDQAGAKIVETIVLMARNLGLKVVAEGVETREQVELLKSFGCDLIQGYYYAKPMPFEAFLSYCTEMNCTDMIGKDK